MTYVSSYYQRFKNYERERNAFNKIRNAHEMVDSSIQSKNLYEIKAWNLICMMRDLANQRNEVCEVP